MDELERTITIPLRATKMAPRTKRAKRAVKEVRENIMRHMKVDAEHVWIDQELNEKLWERGYRTLRPRSQCTRSSSMTDSLKYPFPRSRRQQRKRK